MVEAIFGRTRYFPVEKQPWIIIAGANYSTINGNGRFHTKKRSLDFPSPFRPTEPIVGFTLGVTFTLFVLLLSFLA